MPTHPLLAMARTLGNPVFEGEVATLIWQGTSAPNLIDDLHNWDEAPQKMLRAGSELWSFSIPLPADAYVEYAFIDPQTNDRIPDPLNPNRVNNGVNGYNQYFYMPQGKPSPLIHPVEGVPQGKVTKYTLPTRDFAASANRSVYLYQPPVTSPVPLLFVYDGSDYLRRAKLNNIVDNLIAEKCIQPFAMALVPNGGAARTVEYSCSESTIGLLMECVLPVAKEHLNLEPIKNGRYGVMGSSLGGSMALFTALRLPQIFCKVISQSGAFIAPDYQCVVVDIVKYAPPPTIDIWMDSGRLEWLLEGNRQMYSLLKEKRYRVKYREFSGGHNFTAWRDDIWHGLEALYGK
ncbi:MAG: alpha/beta hydrolase-fold protein [Anaerolineales bacterium]